MNKTTVIAITGVIQKIILTSTIIAVTVLSFSLNIPQKICRTIAEDILKNNEPTPSFPLAQIFSLSPGNTVYAAMPAKQPHEITPTPKISNPTPVASPLPTNAPPPQSDLSATQKIQLKNHTKKSFDVPELLNKPLLYQDNSNGYKVLLVHTHTTESYFPNDRSEHPEENMIAIGKEFKKVLEENGIPTLHITTVHDVPYTTSYKKSLESVTKALEEHPSIEVVIDLHRDAIVAENGEKMRPVANINNQQAAQVMLVCGTDEGGLPHPDWKENLAFALKVQNKMQKNYPNLARPLDLRRERFNTHTTKNSVIFEIGSHGNTPEEAARGAKLAAQSVADVLNKN